MQVLYFILFVLSIIGLPLLVGKGIGWFIKDKELCSMIVWAIGFALIIVIADVAAALIGLWFLAGKLT